MGEQNFIGLPLEVWGAAILGGVLTFIGTLIFQGIRAVRTWRRETRPAWLLLGRIGNAHEPCYIFVRDFFIPQTLQVPVPAAGGQTQQVSARVPLLARDGRTGSVGQVPNVYKLWSSVESSALADLLYVFALAGKNENVHVVEMSDDTGIWNGSVVVLGAQAQKSFDFYRQMEGVAYRMTAKSIIQVGTGRRIRPRGYGYGIILKARNPLRTNGGPGTALLIGGFGTLGTEAAGYYFRTHYKELAGDFGRRTFGIVVRASIDGGPESAERLHGYDRATEAKSRSHRAYERIFFWVHKQL